MAAEAEIAAFAMVVLIAAGARALAQFFSAPATPVFIAAGFAVRTFTPVQLDVVRELLIIALTFLLFAAGVAMNPGRFTRRTLPSAVLFGIIGAGAAGLPAVLVANLAGWSSYATPYAAVAVAASSILVVHQLLAMRGELGYAHGRLLVQSLLLQDLTFVVLLAILPHAGGTPAELVAPAAGVLALMVLAALGSMAAQSRVLRRLAPDEELRTLVAFGTIFAFVLLTVPPRLPAVAGAFLAGLALAPFPANVYFRPAVRASRDFFSPIFFVSLGLLFPLPQVADLPLVLALLGLILVLKPLVLAATACVAGFTRRVSVTAGLLAGQGSEFTLALAILGGLAGHLTESQLGILGATVALTMLATSFGTPLLRRLLSRHLPAEAQPTPTSADRPVVVLGAGSTGTALMEHLTRRGTRVVGLDVDPHALERVPPGVHTIRGDATSPAALAAANVQDARGVAVLLEADQDAFDAAVQVLLRAPPGARGAVVVRCQSEMVARALERRGAVAVRTADAVAATLRTVLDSPERGEDEGAATGPA